MGLILQQRPQCFKGGRESKEKANDWQEKANDWQEKANDCQKKPREQVQRFEPNISEDAVLKKMFSKNFQHIVVAGK